MSLITFLRIRPTESLHQLSATTRFREGTTAVELAAPTPDDLNAADEAGLLVLSADREAAAAGFIFSTKEAEATEKQGLSRWRLTAEMSVDHEAIVNAVSRVQPRFLRSSRSEVAAAAYVANLPGVKDTAVSTFVDDVSQALTAVGAGATDLLLRDWSTEGIGELRDALADRQLVERTALPLGIEIDDARAVLPKAIFKAWLNQTDAGGAARPRGAWAPGLDMEIPAPLRRISAQWQDSAWTDDVQEDGLLGVSPEIAGILTQSLDGVPPSRDDIETLFGARGRDVEGVAWAADQLRQLRKGDPVTYVVNRNINYTNQCYFKCGFCAFSKGPRSLDLREVPYLMSIDEVVDRSVEAAERGATEVCLQGGIHPEFTGSFYLDMVKAIKAKLPDMHIHGFTPLEIWQGAETLDTTITALLADLAKAGLGSLPGTAAEILDDDVRLFLCPDKIRTAQWAEVMTVAHGLGLGSTATIMMGHIDTHRSWANHIEVVREVQRRTGGFTEFVPLPFVHMGAPIWLQGKARPGPTWDEVVLIHAVARLAFDGLIDNIQASWVKLGIEGGLRLINSGCNDFGGTLMDESITRAAGADHGTELTSEDFIEAIDSIDRTAVERRTDYSLRSDVPNH